jgi:hypothetical protein
MHRVKSGKSAISHWETGLTLPKPPMVTRIATALRCPTAALLEGVVTPYDALRGQQEQSGPDILLSEDETALIRYVRQLSPEDRAFFHRAAPLLAPRRRLARHTPHA